MLEQSENQSGKTCIKLQPRCVCVCVCTSKCMCIARTRSPLTSTQQKLEHELITHLWKEKGKCIFLYPLNNVTRGHSYISNSLL